MGVTLAYQVPMCTHAHMHALYRAYCMTFQAKNKRYLCTVEPESWVKLLIRIIRKRINRDHLHHHCLHKCSRRLCYCCDLGSRYLGACLGVGAFHLNSQNSYMGAYRGVSTCPGHYSICKVLLGCKCQFLVPIPLEKFLLLNTPG